MLQTGSFAISGGPMPEVNVHQELNRERKARRLVALIVRLRTKSPPGLKVLISMDARLFNPDTWETLSRMAELASPPSEQTQEIVIEQLREARGEGVDDGKD